MMKFFSILLCLLISIEGYCSMDQEGFLNVSEKNGRYYFCLTDDILNRDILIINRYIGVTHMGRLPDDQIEPTGDKFILTFRKGDSKNQIILLEQPTKNYIYPSSPELEALYNRSSALPVLQTFDIKKGIIDLDSSAMCIDVTDWLKQGKGFITAKADSITHTYADSLKAVFIADRSFENKMNQRVATVFFLLPKTAMRPRKSDGRVGYFKAETVSLTDKGITPNVYNCKWRLEPREQDRKAYFRGELVEPKEPIIFYIDPAIPKQWVPMVIRSVNNWQGALEKAGFKNAIMAREAPKDDPGWSLAACKAAVVFKASAIQNMIGPNVNDPRSGEIIQTHISWFHNINSWIWSNYFVQASPNDPAARNAVFNDSLMESLLETIITHEVGHALGLVHNMGASSTVPVEKLRNNKWLQKNGHTPSIMDYSRYNYVAQPEDRIAPALLNRHIAVYDRWAIEAGYRLLPDFETEEQEDDFMQRWIGKQSRKPELMFYDGESDMPKILNPGAQTEDVGDDPIAAGLYGIQNLKRVTAHLPQWLGGGEEQNYLRRELLNTVINVTDRRAPAGQFSNYMYHVAKLIGGVYYHSTAVPFKFRKSYVPRIRQKEAVQFLTEQLFKNPVWLLQDKLAMQTAKVMPDEIFNLQTAILQFIFYKWSYMEKQAVIADDPYPIYELLEDLKTGIWTELYQPQEINAMRRKLQLAYIQEILSILNRRDVLMKEGLVVDHCKRIRADIEQAIASDRVPENEAHLKNLLLVLSKFK